MPRTNPSTFRLFPYRVRLGIHPEQAQARAQAQAVLSAQRPAFLIPAAGKVEVWAGVEDEREGQVLSAQLGTGLVLVQERRCHG